MAPPWCRTPGRTRHPAEHPAPSTNHPAPALSPSSATLAASGGTAPYTWSVFGQLPPGLSLAASTGGITGTPTTSGLFSFAIQVAESGPQTASAQFSINITVGGSAIHHVFLVLLENHNYADVIGSASMPFLNGLATQNSLATQFYANTHPSIGNYFWFTTGQVITNDDSFSGTVSVDNVVRQLVAAGRTWKGYAEDLPSVGWTASD